MVRSKNRWDVWGVVSHTTPVKLCNLYPHLRLETAFSALKLSQNYYMNGNIGSLSPVNMPCLKDNPHSRTNTKGRKLQKSQVSNFLLNLKKFMIQV